MTKRNYVGLVTKTCEHCAQPVTRKNSQFREHVFCTRRCYWASTYVKERRRAQGAARYPAHRRVEPCLNCGTLVERPLSRFNATTFCSVPCRRRYAVMREARQINGGGYVIVFIGKGAAGASSSGHIPGAPQGDAGFSSVDSWPITSSRFSIRLSDFGLVPNRQASASRTNSNGRVSSWRSTNRRKESPA